MMQLETLLAADLSRRSLLKAAGVLAGGLALGPLALRFAGANRLEPLTVGVALPRSSLYPQLGASLLAGLAQAIASTGRELALLVDEHGSAPSSAAAAATRLADQGAQVLVGPFSSAALALVAPLLDRRQIPLIATIAGANIPRGAAPSPYIFRHTLGLWQANLAAGAWAATLGRRAVIVASAHDSGFDAIDAFQLGFEQSGGHVVDAALSHRPGAASSLHEALATVAASRADFIFAAYSGSEGQAFVRAFADSGLARHLPVVASGLLADAVTPAAGLPTLNGVLAWSPALDTAHARRLRDGDAFAALGYDTGLLINAGLGKGSALRDSFAGARVAGARGSLQVDPATGLVDSPLYLGTTNWSATGRHDALIAEFPTASSFVERAAPLLAAPKTGWLNAYLCI